MARPNARESLLDAAAVVVSRGGPAALTLDAVAARAGVSKGGLLYHFPTKRALVEAMLTRWTDGFTAEVEAAAAGDTRAGAWTRAYARAAGSATAADDEIADQIAMLAVLAEAPERLDAVRERYAVWQARFGADGIDTADATLVRLAADGLWFSQLLGLAPPEGELLERVRARLEELGGG